MTFYNEMSLNE